MARVFLSHSSKDSNFVSTELVPLLESNGVSTWYSIVDIRSAEEWERSIREGLESCDWFLVVVSLNSVQSEWVRAEVDWALEHRKGRVIPVLLGGAKPHALDLRLRRIEYVDYRKDRDTARVKLLASWQELGRTDRTSAPTVSPIDHADPETKSLELVDVRILDDLPTLDIKVRNRGTEIHFIKQAVFTVHKVWYVHPSGGILGHVPSSATYDVVLESENAPYSKTKSLSQAVEPIGADRFCFRLAITGDHIFLISVELVFDEESRSIHSKKILLFRSNSTSFYDPFKSSRRFNVLKCSGIYHNKQVLGEITALDAIRQNSLRCVEQYIRSYYPALEQWADTQRNSFRKLTADESAIYREVEHLLDPRLELIVEDTQLRVDYCSEIDDSHMIYFGVLVKLRKLDISNCQKVGDAGIRYLAGLLELRTLDLSWTGITDKGMQHLAGLVNIEELYLRGVRISDLGLGALGRMKRLKKLNLSETQTVTDIGLLHLSRLTSLKKLDLYGSQVTDDGLKHLVGLVNLQDLDIGSTLVSKDGVAELLRALPSVKVEPDLNEYPNPNQVAATAEIRRLGGEVLFSGGRTSAYIDIDTGISVGAVLEHVGTLPDLEELVVRGKEVSESVLEHIGRIINLKELDLRCTPFDDEGIKHLKNLRNLEKLDLVSTQVTDAGLKQLYDMDRLVELRLLSCRVTAAGVKKIRKALPKCSVEWYRL
jgi:Leucine-rich repeat (LRR) protein